MNRSVVGPGSIGLPSAVAVSGPIVQPQCPPSFPPCSDRAARSACSCVVQTMRAIWWYCDGEAARGSTRRSTVCTPSSRMRRSVLVHARGRFIAQTMVAIVVVRPGAAAAGGLGVPAASGFGALVGCFRSSLLRSIALLASAPGPLEGAALACCCCCGCMAVWTGRGGDWWSAAGGVRLERLGAPERGTSGTAAARTIGGALRECTPAREAERRPRPAGTAKRCN